ncbi:potassium-transporting ATPase subunit F [Streptomyces sp. NPDC054863]
MTVEHIVGTLVAVALVGYLLAARINSDRF